jgi:predicted nucleic acid-binding protein
MSHLLDSDTCTAIIRNTPLEVGQAASRHRGRLHASVISVTELEVWLLRRRTPLRYSYGFLGLMQVIALIDVNEAIAHRAALVTRELARQGQRMGVEDTLIAATALERGLTLVTRSPVSFSRISGLTVVDWSVP